MANNQGAQRKQEAGTDEDSDKNTGRQNLNQRDGSVGQGGGKMNQKPGQNQGADNKSQGKSKQGGGNR